MRHVPRDSGWKPKTPEQAQARVIRNSWRWQKFRAWIIKRYPLCMNPDCNGRTPATQVHHIEPVSERPDLAFTMENCPPVCTYCHAKIEAAERRGDETRIAFKDWWLK